MTNFMYKRVNIFLLILMCLIVVGLAGSAIYFQESFKDLNDNYESVLSNFQVCNQTLTTRTERLDACVEDLNTTAQDIGKYDTLYDQKVADLETTQEELSLTDKELKQTKLDLQQAQSAFKKEQERTIDLQNQIQDLEDEISLLESQLNSCEDDLNACQNP